MMEHIKEYLFSQEGRLYLLEEYVKNERSIYSLAREQKTYPNMILRAMVYHQIPRRNLSQAQKAALQSGRHGHPTRGGSRRESTRRKISQRMCEIWASLDPEVKKLRTAEIRQRWLEMPVDRKQDIIKLAMEGVKKAVRSGTRLERYIKQQLVDDYQVLCRVRVDGFRVDLFLPTEKVCVLVDGPGHHLPFWGEQHLQRTIARDQRKKKALHELGYSVFRVTHIRGRAPYARLTAMIRQLKDFIEASSRSEKPIAQEVELD